MIVVNGVKIPLDYDDNLITKILEKKLKTKVNYFKIVRKSVDARKEVFFSMNFHVSCKNESKLKYDKVVPYKDLVVPKYHKGQVVIVGAGPAGLFAGLVLAYANAKPIILERGCDIKQRDMDVDKLFKERVINPNSNVAFGLGGAGTYSDGKLTTNINNEYNRFVLNELVKYGAPEEILYLAKPHIGTDILKNVVTNIANKIVELGGEIKFSHQFIDFIDGEEKVVIARFNDELVKINAESIILAIGHSARDTFRLLKEKNLYMEQKPFSMGVRVEHKQELINDIQYKMKHKNLPPAEYKMAVHLDDRDVYTFCMCPGGIVVPSMQDKNILVTNGMSYHSRSLENANSAVLVNVKPSDYESDDPLAGVYFQEKYERLAFELTKNYKAPVSLLGDFLNDKTSVKLGGVTPSFILGYEFKDLRLCLPDFVVKSLKEAFYKFDVIMPGFKCDDAILTAIESRSSSPVRIKRDENFESNIKGIYPCGEGAGYAGGIMTSALDGIKIALKILEG